MDKTIEIQDIYSSNHDFSEICSLDIEVIDAPTAPLIHQMARFIYIFEGKGVIKLQGQDYHLRPGTLLSVLPWQMTDVIAVEEPLQYYLLAYYFDNINNWVKSVYGISEADINIMDDMMKAPVVYCDDREMLLMSNLFEQIRAEIGLKSMYQSVPKDPYRDLLVNSKILELFSRFLRLGSGQRSLTETEEAGSIDKSEILQYIYNNLSRKITLAQLSKIFYMSEASISSYISQTTGLNFYDLLNEMRIGKTINFLLYTNLTMEDLAEILGFVDSSHISKVFSARVGMQANEFRKTYQNVYDICNTRIPRMAYEIVSYIYHQYSEELTPKSTAEKFKISVKELNTILLYQVEKNFSDFLNYVRVNRASEILKNTSRSVTDIAIEVGYNNSKTLTRNFLKFRKMTPGVFREIEVQENSL